MTPERAEWYDSLSPEEKMTRIHFGYFKHSLSVQKERLADLNIEPSNQDEIKECKGGIRATKLSIRALRKQIAMRPYIDNTKKLSPYSCPRCNNGLLMYLPYCGACGQKLRWD